jgi:hypothetical protein
MGALLQFTDLESKKKHFSETEHYKIDTKEQFDRWFGYYTSDLKEGKKTDFMFRGMSDARYKLYTSAQRLWIENDLSEWSGSSYLDFINKMIQETKEYPLIKKVFDTFDYNAEEREVPILSLLQHYSAPTPFMDWSYNINVALFFAVEGIKTGNGSADKINNYFSIYRINKRKYEMELLNITDYSGYEGKPFNFFKSIADEEEPASNFVFYISDFDEGNTGGTGAKSEIVVKRSGKLLTSVYNQNIIPQEGLFIFNPFSKKTIDDIFNLGIKDEGANLSLAPFACFNIKKDMADYVRRHVQMAYNINNDFIYPKLNMDAETIKNKVLNACAG